MNFSATSQAIILLTARFSSKEEPAPLTISEWAKFAVWLKNNHLMPEDLLVPNPAELLVGWVDKKVTVERIVALLRRGNAFALTMERWSRAGIWIITRADADYPQRFKVLLKHKAPPILFGCGNRDLLNSDMKKLAVVGSREARDEDLLYTKILAQKLVSIGGMVVSGGARGVDKTSMETALGEGGYAIGVLPDGLLKASTSSQWRKALQNNFLALISMVSPDTIFSKGLAMARNKYIYCLSDAAVAVCSDVKGGTYTGALENIKERWVPLWVKDTKDLAGNQKIINSGAAPLTNNENLLDINQLFSDANNSGVVQRQSDISYLHVAETSASYQKDKLEETTPISTEIELANHCAKTLNQEFYSTFLNVLTNLTQTAKSLDELQDLTQLNKEQLKEWLAQAEKDNYIEKVSKRPIRYQLIQSELFLKEESFGNLPT